MESLQQKRSHCSLPSKEDFCGGGAPDATVAWEDFGGLTLDEAYNKLVDDAVSYAGGFYWMFPPAFAYYFPIVDKYLREYEPSTDMDHCPAASLGSCLHSQFHWTTGAKPPPSVVEEIAALSDFVKANPGRYSSEKDEQMRILENWTSVDLEVAAFRQEHTPPAPFASTCIPVAPCTIN